MAAKNINANEFHHLLRGRTPVLVDFWAPWCPHCRKISAAYDQIADQYANQLEIVKLNMDELDTLWKDLNVELIPTLRLYVDGKPVSEIIAPESKEAIDEFLTDYLPEEQRKETSQVYDMIIIGGGPGGYTAALYAARAGLRTLVLEKLAAGGQMALTHQIDNYPGFTEGIGGYELGLQMQRQAERLAQRPAMPMCSVSISKQIPSPFTRAMASFLAKPLCLPPEPILKSSGLPMKRSSLAKEWPTAQPATVCSTKTRRSLW